MNQFAVCKIPMFDHPVGIEPGAGRVGVGAEEVEFEEWSSWFVVRGSLLNYGFEEGDEEGEFGFAEDGAGVGDSNGSRESVGESRGLERWRGRMLRVEGQETGFQVAEVLRFKALVEHLDAVAAGCAVKLIEHGKGSGIA